MHVEEPGKPGRSGLSIDWFEREWDRAKNVWENRWKSAFTPGNDFFSGNAPLLVTEDAAIREIYYRSVLTLLVLLRTNLWSNRTFITSGERPQGCGLLLGHLAVSTLFALLEPKQMKEQIKLSLSRIRTRARLSFSKPNDPFTRAPRGSRWMGSAWICGERSLHLPAGLVVSRSSRRTRSFSARRSPTRRFLQRMHVWRPTGRTATKS